MATALIKRYLQELARWLRNQKDYDDFEYGTEPIRGDRTWCKKCASCECKAKQTNQDTVK